MASSKETYCLCGQPYISGQFMIECDCCREWFHGSCVDVKVYQSDDIDKYHCPKCSPTYGPSVLKVPTNKHRADRYELGAETRASQVGSPAWVRALAARPPRPHPQATQRVSAQQFTEDFVRDNGFTRPVYFPTSEGLELRTPNPATFTSRSVLRFCGAQLEVEVIDVRKQATLRMALGEFIEYFETPPELRDERVLNVLSLEFSDTNLSPHVTPPALARRLDWAELVWPAAEERPPRPAVQKYCIMSSQGSYTDFHVDFGGTTVWYHVLHGRKIFYLIPPTSTNLALYQQWSASNNQNERFFGDMVEWYGTAELSAGQTLFIPSGWIHAVLTPIDSLVFGGNFLHSFAIETQLQIYEIERRVETPTMLRYPLFEALHWYAGAYLLTMLRRHNEESQDEEFTLHESYLPNTPAEIAPLLLRGIKLLASALKEWHALKSTDTAKRDNVPKCLNSGQLVRELCKELRTLEKRTQSKEFKLKSPSISKSQKKVQNTQKKAPLKLTLPKPIMHMGQNGEYVDDKLYADKFYIDNKEVIYQDNRYVANGMQETYIVDGKDIVLQEKYTYQGYEDVQSFQDNGFIEKKTLKIKMASPSSSREEAVVPPPPYSVPEHSILKSHLIRTERAKPAHQHQWTISKKDIGDYHDEQILFTNDNMRVVDQQQIAYGPGMYSAEDIQTDYQYSEAAKSGAYGEYAYGTPAPEVYSEVYRRYDTSVQPDPAMQGAAYSTVSLQEQLNGSYQAPALPTYDAAMAHQQYVTTDYIVEEQKPAPPTPVRRSERPVRRRVSNTYDYEDGDLYIDDTPAPRRRKPAKSKQAYRHNSVVNGSGGSGSGYRSSGGSGGGSGNARLPPVNGIESLIQASVLAGGGDQADNDTEDAAVAGMLSISERYDRTFGLASDHQRDEHDSTPSTSKRKRRAAAAASSAEEDLDDEEDVIKEVHRDEEYVYPSLEMSSDEDEEWSSSRRRRSRHRNASRTTEKDESWSPRARLGRLVPRVRRTARAGVRKESVRAALHAAATAAATAVPPTTPPPHTSVLIQNAKRSVLATKSRRPPPPAQPSPSKKDSRLKKGMKTAKQRLGKILKIHKMMY